MAGLETWTVVLLVGASFFGSFLTAAFGIGGGAFLLAVMASLIPPAALIPVHGVVQIGSNALRALVMMRHTYLPPIGAFAAGSGMGAVLGGLVTLEIPPAVIQIGVGAFILWSVLLKSAVWISRAPFLAGGISSFLTMFFGATGLFVANFVSSLDISRTSHVATHAVLMTFQHVLKVAVFAVLGFVYTPWVELIFLMITAGFIGTLIGRHVLFRVTDDVFKHAFRAILVLLAMRLIWSGAQDVWM
jgi:uncharacterized membrane protein YfcA